MIPELGHFGLILALLLAATQAVFGLSGAARNDPLRMASARNAAIGQFIFVATGFLILGWSFYSNDFSVLNVAEHSSRHLPTAYRITATWGSHEGSILLWTLILSGWTLCLAWPMRSDTDVLGTNVLGILGLISSGMLAFILFTSNPFQRLDPPPPDGLDLNPLLQDPGMILHPPLLYMGYVGFSIAFAFAVAALVSRQFDGQWAKRATPWTLVAWTFLTLGIMVGSWWAYYELGWGGWWFWDPTENASLMPWLVGTALLHSLNCTARRGLFPIWTLLLAVGSFGLSLLGTFLVRSGVLSSVHAFAQDPARGFFLLLLLTALVGLALIVLARRTPRTPPPERHPGAATIPLREAMILAGNVVLLVVTATVLLGTLYPLVLDALGQGKVSVGPPYFNSVFVPLMVPVLILLGIAPGIGQSTTSLQQLVARIRWPLLLAALLGPLLSLTYGEFRWQAACGVSLASWILLTTLRGSMNRSTSLRRTGMLLAHCGIAVGIIGIAMVSAFETEQSLSFNVGDTATIAGYEVRFDGIVEIPGDNYSAVQGKISASKSGKPVAELRPEKRIYHASKMPITESAIHYGFLGDLYVVLGDALSRDTWTVRLYYKPFIAWIWIGALMMAAGALLAALTHWRQQKGLSA